MEIQIKFSSKTYSWLCFRHAVQEAMRGEDIKPEIDDWSSNYYMGTTFCILCSSELNESKEDMQKWYDHFREDK